MTREAAHARALEIEGQALREATLGENFNGQIHLVLLDLETTGLIRKGFDVHITEIAVKHFSNGEHFTTLVNPEMDIPASTTEFNKISNDMVKSAPTMDHVGRMLCQWLSKFSCPQDIVIFLAHYGDKFDKPILIAELDRAHIPIPLNWRFSDSIPLFKKVFPNLTGQRPYRLEKIHQHIFSSSIKDQHRAEGDIDALYKCLKHTFAASTDVDAEKKIVDALFVPRK